MEPRQFKWLRLKGKRAVPLANLSVLDGDHEHFSGPRGERYEHILLFGAAASELWRRGITDVHSEDMTTFDCPGGKQHEWDQNLAVAGSSNPVLQCRKCKAFDEEIRGDIESRLEPH
jgi:hypothetical protein